MTREIRLMGWACLALLVSISGSHSQAPPATFPSYSPAGYFPGVNLAGAEFGKGGVLGKAYVYPTEEEFAYFQGKGFKIVRIPFKWERVQPQLLGDLDPANLKELDRCVTQANQHGLTVILDVHNYAGRPVNGHDLSIGIDPGLASAHFNDLWVKLATHFKDNPLAWFGLMNEPHKQTPAQTAAIMQSAVNAIRSAGAKNKILVPGAAWTGAHSWIKKGNGAAYENFKDPENNFVFEVHQYLDKDYSGHDPQVVTGCGSTLLVAFPEWARQHHFKAFLGEYSWDGSATNTQAPIEGEALLNYMDQNRDVWTGFTFWSAGPSWHHYLFSIEPSVLKEGAPIDANQLPVVLRHLH